MTPGEQNPSTGSAAETYGPPRNLDFSHDSREDRRYGNNHMNDGDNQCGDVNGRDDAGNGTASDSDAIFRLPNRTRVSFRINAYVSFMIIVFHTFEAFTVRSLRRLMQDNLREE
ncbi:unnamed protein product [Haemonchus placei]|uniref:Acyl_transf_3 domain-containing protein n=1 Tax=Haemonchus placei TaxID=6290 RepID=A0A0N4WQA6_HAEPC|nr:unnamed protein product [Haemonchus placei]